MCRQPTLPTVLVSLPEHNTGELPLKEIPKCLIFRSVADDVAAAIVSHWNGDYLYESENRYIGNCSQLRRMKLTFKA